MPSSVATTIISNSNAAWKVLHGVVCVYKPVDWGFKKVLKEFKRIIVDDLNQMERLPRKEIIEIRRVGPEPQISSRIPLENESVIGNIEDGRKRIEIVKGLSYSDHPLVAGPAFKTNDIKIIGASKSSSDISGVHLYGVNKGMSTVARIIQSRWLRTYLISGKFGIATDNFFHTGTILEKSTFGSIKRHFFEKYLASVQSTHQRLSFLASGVPLESQRAYELASQGLVRPAGKTTSIIFSIKCIEFDLPNFTLEVKAINEDGDDMKRLIHDIGLKLHTCATCTKLMCTNVGPFGINDALLTKHWNIQNILDNMKNCREVLKDFKLEELELWVDNPDEAEPKQNKEAKVHQ